MKAIVIVMLGVQLLMLAAVAVAVLKRRPAAAGLAPSASAADSDTADPRRRPVWSSLSIALLIAASTSFQIAGRHPADPAAELLRYGSGVLMGMCLMGLLLAFRERRDR